MDWFIGGLILSIALVSILLGGSYWISGKTIGLRAARRNLLLVLIWTLVTIAIAVILIHLNQWNQFDFADAYFVLYVIGISAWLLSWPLRRQAAGELLINIGRTWQNKLMFWNAWGVVGIAAYFTWLSFRELIQFPEYTGPISETVKVIFFWIFAIYFFSLGLNGFELRENGICSMHMFIPWRRMKSYAWQPPQSNKLIIEFKRLPLLPGFMIICIQNHHRDPVNHILATHIPSSNT